MRALGHWRRHPPTNLSLSLSLSLSLYLSIYISIYLHVNKHIKWNAPLGRISYLISYLWEVHSYEFPLTSVTLIKLCDKQTRYKFAYMYISFISASLFRRVIWQFYTRSKIKLGSWKSENAWLCYKFCYTPTRSTLKHWSKHPMLMK